MTAVEIVEGDLVIRPWRPTDAEAVFRACQDPDIQRWTTVPVPYKNHHAHHFVTNTAPWRDGTGAPLGVFDRATGDLVGSSGLVALGGGTGEIGYWTAPWARGRGAATAATRAVARWAVTELGVRRLVWRAEVGNHRSRLVALRAGFTIEGIARDDIEARDGSRRDAWVGSLLPRDLDRAAPIVGTVETRRAAVFSRPQPVLFAGTPTGEIRLRPLEERDLDAVLAAARDPDTTRWISLPDPYRREDGENFVREHAPGVWRRGTGAVFAIGDPRDDAYSGVIELRLDARRPAVGDVGFLVAPRARGRGFAPAALAAVSAWGFTALHLHRVSWFAYVGNEASRRVAEKAGFTIEGTARGLLTHHGERVDAWTGGLLASDEPYGRGTP